MYSVHNVLIMRKVACDTAQGKCYKCSEKSSYERIITCKASKEHNAVQLPDNRATTQLLTNRTV